MATSGPGQFLCGCWPLEKEHYKVERRDARGVLCPEHGEPLYGFLSPQIEQPGLGRVHDHGKKSTGGTLNLDTSKMEDKRDNREPLSVYRELQRDKAVAGNGHA